MLSNLINFMVVRLRGRPFKIDPSITNAEIMTLLIRQGICLFRGVLRTRKLVSIGRSVILTSKNRIQFSKGASIGQYCTIDAIGKNGIVIGSATSIGSFSLLKVSGTFVALGKGITIGSNVGIGEFAHIGGAGGVNIGDDTIIGSYFSVHPENHNFDDISIPIRLQGVTHKGIRVGKGCWIGAKVTLLDGSKVGDGCVIAAGAVVKGEFPDNCVIGGIPAKILKER
jgi:acetyltransferase-like isoleucine patch superfamily enzyme